MSERTYLAIIPARKGSKRLPGKNKRLLCGKPLIQWTIEAAVQSKVFKEIVVTSDDNAVLELAKKFPVSVHRRPEHLATDEASSFDVVEDVVNCYSECDVVVLLQPTSPLRTQKHIADAVAQFEEKRLSAVIGVTRCVHSPLWIGEIGQDGSMDNFLNSKFAESRSQDHPAYYQLNGAIYICEKLRLLNEKRFFLSSNTFAFAMDRKSSVDIDDELDFMLAEAILSKRGDDIC